MESDEAANTYETRREVLITYLRMKTDVEDWHGVADAACDLRDLDAAEEARLAATSELRR